MRLLLISYAFPPVGGAGVQRVLKLTKYLPEQGVSPSVLTAKNPSVPAEDGSLASEVPPWVEVVRARTLEPAYSAKRLAWAASAGHAEGPMAKARAAAVTLFKSLLVPDPQVLWLPAAASALARRLVSRPPDVVMLSGPPFSQFLLALLARMSPGTGVVLDYRDEWTTTSSVYEMASPAASAVDAHLERAVLRRAHRVTTATEAFRQRLLDRFEFLDPSRVHTIENGYDPADLPRDGRSAPGDRVGQLVLTYVGTVFRLTSAAGLLAALRKLHEREPELAQRLRVRFVGRIVETEAEHFAHMEALGVERVGYVAHARSLEELASSDAALCLLDDVPGAERVYPAKIFEIAALRRPCLVLCPEGALAELVRRHRIGEVLPPRDSDAICELLARWLRQLVAGSFPERSAPVDIERFDRRRQAATFAEVLRRAREDATAPARPGRPRDEQSGPPPARGPARRWATASRRSEFVGSR